MTFLINKREKFILDKVVAFCIGSEIGSLKVDREQYKNIAINLPAGSCPGESVR